MTDQELTAIATAVGVMKHDMHRPPLEHVSPSAAALAEDDLGEFSLTWRDAAAAAAGIAGFWAFYVGAWALLGGAA